MWFEQWELIPDVFHFFSPIIQCNHSVESTKKKQILKEKLLFFSNIDEQLIRYIFLYS